MAAPVVYVVVGYLVARTKPAAALPLPVVAVLTIAALGTVALAYILPRRQWARARELRNRDRDAALGVYQNAMVIHWCCLEAVAIYGLVLTILNANWLLALAGSVLALALLASARPRPDELVGR
jgi:hypothetical protein